jgi:hypothetical protein
MTGPRLLRTAADVTPHLLTLVTDCVEGWFPPPRPMPTEEFVDRLCGSYANGWDIEELDSPAVRKIMRHAHHVRREMS